MDSPTPHTDLATASPDALSPALRAAFAEMDRRLAAAPDPLANFTREDFEAARREGIGDTLGVGPRLAPR
jgi:hypothetical protein